MTSSSRALVVLACGHQRIFRSQSIAPREGEAVYCYSCAAESTVAGEPRTIDRRASIRATAKRLGIDPDALARQVERANLERRAWHNGEAMYLLDDLERLVEAMT